MFCQLLAIVVTYKPHSPFLDHETQGKIKTKEGFQHRNSVILKNKMKNAGNQLRLRLKTNV